MIHKFSIHVISLILRLLTRIAIHFRLRSINFSKHNHDTKTEDFHDPTKKINGTKMLIPYKIYVIYFINIVQKLTNKLFFVSGMSYIYSVGININ